MNPATMSFNERKMTATNVSIITVQCSTSKDFLEKSGFIQAPILDRKEPGSRGRFDWK